MRQASPRSAPGVKRLATSPVTRKSTVVRPARTQHPQVNTCVTFPARIRPDFGSMCHTGVHVRREVLARGRQAVASRERFHLHDGVVNDEIGSQLTTNRGGCWECAHEFAIPRPSVAPRQFGRRCDS